MKCCICKQPIPKKALRFYVSERRPSDYSLPGKQVYRYQCLACHEAGRTNDEYERMAHGFPWEQRRNWKGAAT